MLLGNLDRLYPKKLGINLKTDEIFKNNYISLMVFKEDMILTELKCIKHLLLDLYEKKKKYDSFSKLIFLIFKQ